ncbi:Trimeric GatFAB AmidoTransferase(AdT) complex subunit [Pseudogymnoascus destructans]|uniref:Glutamyl-tRNA(Gln) amidotransferase subunit A, mitochondrial n=2 Tax=Pseudogymnoascus destructans TaxID=655981 RepID=L8FQ30_PSED2|nr:Trimeric GatFAB AmidoTransferase(AdT) complex subunit [Pseudogymnoascus destructans]ELR01821.1 hypothetical protein GMDG_00921 [Pseudogymnoascus destructans 20631-21]OAF58662.1 Trimeric GatFAB AmidoTransferase(AdT) complex subunit [Pseudogymnoascus destructans]
MGSRISEKVVAVAKAGLKRGPRNSPSNAFIRREKSFRKWKLYRPTILPNRFKILAVKDNISTTSFETTCASNFLKDYEPPFDADVIKSLYQRGGAVVASKTNMDEFGMGSHSVNSHYGAVTNSPPFEAYSAGGSSGGSAQAVASGSVQAALGTDTGGSVRLPAAYSGVTGLKPSYGRISRHGVVPYAHSLDTVGLFCKNPEDMTVFLLAGQDLRSRDPTTPMEPAIKRMSDAIRREEARLGRWPVTDTKPLRIGVPAEYNIAELSPAVRHTWQRTLDTLRSHGHAIVPVSLPSTKHALSAYYIIAAAEASSNLAKFDGVRYGSREDASDNPTGVLYASTRGAGFGDEVRRRILLGTYSLSASAMDNFFVQAQRVRRLVQRDFDRVFAVANPLHPEKQFDLADMPEMTEMDSKLGPAQVDVLVVPTAPTLPPLIKDVRSQGSLAGYTNDVFTVPASLAGLPAISVPVPIAEEAREKGNVGFVGMQVIGQYYDDFHVINVGSMVAAGVEWPSKLEKLEERWAKMRGNAVRRYGFKRPIGFGDK